MLPRFKLKKYKCLLGRWLLVVLAVFCLLGLINVVRAQTDFGLNQQFSETSGLSDTNLIVIVAKIIRALLGLLGIIAVILIIYAGWMWMTSQGEEEKVSTAKKILINAVIGLVIIMSALGIAQFVLNRFTGANFGGTGSNTAPTITWKNFNGSGSLGRQIKDHYPLRDEVGVKRNTQIIITFRESIDVTSTVRINTNPGTVPGVCNIPTSGSFSWTNDCWHINTSSIKIYNTPANANETPVYLDAALVAVYENQDNVSVAKTFIFHLFDLLGSSTSTMDYTVELTSEIKKVDGTTSLFANARVGQNKYVWNFQTGLETDFDPPHVVEVNPPKTALGNASIARNEIIQITFNEPMDPSSVQGEVGNGDDQTFTNIIFNTAAARGEWKITNGYRTVEFIPLDSCGVLNSCGQTMYCLPVVGSTADPYDILIRTAQTLADSWQAIPFSGVTDIAGNALDNVPFGVRNSKPGITSVNNNFATSEKVSDNYFWGFNVENRIDRAEPYVQKIEPKVDEEEVVEQKPLNITFDRRMFYNSLDGVILGEYASSSQSLNNVDSIWWVLRPETVVESGVSKTKLKIPHREFGPNDLDLFYYVAVTSTIKATNQNCLYPGRGPAPSGYYGAGTGDTCSPVFDVNGVVTNQAASQCVPVTIDANQDTGCAWGSGAPDFRAGTIGECINNLQSGATPSAPPVPLSPIPSVPPGGGAVGVS